MHSLEGLKTLIYPIPLISLLIQSLSQFLAQVVQLVNIIATLVPLNWWLTCFLFY
jgi:hypothetical protein